MFEKIKYIGWALIVILSTYLWICYFADKKDCENRGGRYMSELSFFHRNYECVDAKK